MFLLDLRRLVDLSNLAYQDKHLAIRPPHGYQLCTGLTAVPTRAVLIGVQSESCRLLVQSLFRIPLLPITSI
jgi:hypothetical protein